MVDKSGDEYALITCHNLQSEDALQRILVASKELPIFELELVDCSFRYLPHDAFVGTTIEVLSIRNSNIISLSDSNVAFEGLHNQLHLIEIINCTYLSSWDWTQLSNLKHLMEIHVSDSELIHITEGLATIQHLDIEAFVFHRNKIQDIADNAFAPFENLERLALDNNYISQLKRSMFPKKAKKLSILGLSYNHLQDLPEDLFTNMPVLKSLYLTGNPLVTINERVFRPVWKSLRLFLFYATQLSCDCRIAWLTMEDNSKKYLHAECHGPSSFKGRLLEGIKPQELLKCW
ncbi:Relaxin receptor 1 like protein [Argiope bruennichi]|uniref:Relaxin receptor 1 like protein n=1 Tax=Argiope bruennichi TaxID=94029 RepID=A0A8T0FTP2_ARGBR|nr:Relaxin receptor 1 like protein [Argiope bruennichi]